MPHDVFISYSKDDKLTADAVCAGLEGRGIRCWIAPRDIAPGQDFAEGIIQGIEHTQVMVLIFSAQANASQFVIREVTVAVSQGMLIIPFRIEDYQPSGAMKLHLSTPNWLDAFTEPLGEHIQRLGNRVVAVLGKTLDPPFPVKATLQDTHSRMTITTDPAGAAVYLDEQDTGLCTPCECSVNLKRELTRTVLLELKLAGFAEACFELELKRGASLPISVTLTAQRVRPEVEQTPSGAPQVTPRRHAVSTGRSRMTRQQPEPVPTSTHHDKVNTNPGDVGENIRSQHYNLPPHELLTLTPHSAGPSRDDITEKSLRLEETLIRFGITAKVVGVESGPRITRFEILPPPGVRISKITNLADDIALSLSALDVRVEVPVPGKSVVGIEVPNKELTLVSLREILESDTCRKHKSPLAFALGRDIAGIPRIADLATMPHLLIAGATNSGKSVCINSLLCSILMRATPQQVKFLLIDPKRMELNVFQQIPHLIAPVAYDAKHAAGLLRWAICEMEERYQMFADKGVRNIVGFNEQSKLEGMEELPYIVIAIDELADLMMQAAAEFEASICRLAQLARATGIHLVIATQRASVNVVTGTIKANIPSRIAFAVSSQVDSRMILDMNGAERLVGQGDMLYLPVDAVRPARIQGAYVSEVEINRIVQHLKAQGRPNFSDEIVPFEEEAMRADIDGGNYNGVPEDELFNEALDYIRAEKYVSCSMLQRHFRIGYTRAARLMDLFEDRGFVGPSQGSKPREVILAPPLPS